MLGQKFGRLTVVRRGPNTAGGSARWFCRCECGGDKEPLVLAGALRNGGTKSCGCLQVEAIIKSNKSRDYKTHGMTGTYLYNTLHGMIKRCHNPRSEAFKHYGGRGIVVCYRWRNSFEAFAADVGERPSPDHSIDRIDTNGNYEPGNVRWATLVEQNNNTRANLIVLFRGEKMTAKQAFRASGTSTPLATFYTRLYRGWTIERAVA